MELDVLIVKAKRNLELNKRNWYSAKKRFNANSDRTKQKCQTQRRKERCQMEWEDQLVQDHNIHSHPLQHYVSPPPLPLSPPRLPVPPADDETKSGGESAEGDGESMMSADEAPESAEALPSSKQATTPSSKLYRVKDGSANPLPPNLKSEI